VGQIRPSFQNSHKRSNKIFADKANGEILTKNLKLSCAEVFSAGLSSGVYFLDVDVV